MVADSTDSPLPADPQGVWRLVVRADDLRKYAPNRDPAAALDQAEDVLRKALAAAEALSDRAAGAGLTAQIRTRLDDIAAAREEH